MSSPSLVTERLELRPLSPESLDALVLGDEARLGALTGATFPVPLVPPPFMADVLAYFRDRILAHPDEAGWWSWLAVRRDTRAAVGSVGLGGKPNDAGVVMIGYAMYPEYEGAGYATEAARALLAWALAQPGVSSVHATIPTGHLRSIRVAEKIGMRHTGRGRDPEVGEVLVYSRP